MTHTYHDIDELHRGQDAVQPVTIDGDDGTAKDLTGATVTFYVAERQRDDVRGDPSLAVLQKDTAGGDVTITDAANGELEIRFTPDDYDALPGRVYWYELWVEDGDGNEAPVLHGDLTLDKPSA